MVDWEAIGAIAELFGALGVIATLGYLAVQIRQNTRAVRASSFHAVTDSFNLLNTTIAHDESLARIFRIGTESLGNLKEDELVRFNFLFLGASRIFETLYYQNKQGTGDPALWAAETSTITALLTTSGGREWWASNPLSLTPEFRKFVESEILANAPGEGAA